MQWTDRISFGRTLNILLLAIVSMDEALSWRIRNDGRQITMLRIRDKSFISPLPVMPLPEGFTFIRPIVNSNPINKPQPELVNIPEPETVNELVNQPVPPIVNKPEPELVFETTNEPMKMPVMELIQEATTPEPPTTNQPSTSTALPSIDGATTTFPYPPPAPFEEITTPKALKPYLAPVEEVTDPQVLKPYPPASLQPATPPPMGEEQTHVGEDFKFQIDGDGNYYFRYKTDDSVGRWEMGFLKTIGDARVPVKSYGYRTAEGIAKEVSYVADELGFRITGEHSL